MALGIICRNCGRSGAGGNLITSMDKFTQTIYLTDDGYVFKNPYWHRKRVADPEGFGELIDLLHQEKEPNKKGELEVIKELEKDTLISFYLRRFKFTWIFTDKILCMLPYEYRDWFRVATFFLRPFNEDLPYFGWLKSSVEGRYRSANYERNPDYGVKADAEEWKPRDPDTVGEPAEKPTDEELKFLGETNNLLREFTNNFDLQFEQIRTIYTPEYLDKLKKLVKDYDKNGRWGGRMVIKDYDSIRLNFQVQTEKLQKHIERKLDHKREGYKLFIPTDFLRINDDRMIVTLKRDWVAEWYPTIFPLEGIWQFSKRPLSKAQIQEWNELTFPDGTKKKEPLKTCVFCPEDPGVRSEDFTFDNFPLIIADQNRKADLKKFQKEFIEQIMECEMEELADELADLVGDDEALKSLNDDQVIMIMKATSRGENYKGTTEAGSVSESLKKSKVKLKKEVDRRNLAKKLLDDIHKQREQDRAKKVELERKILALNTALETARTNNNQHEIDKINTEKQELQTQITNLGENIDTAQRALEEMGDRTTREVNEVRERNNRTNEGMNSLVSGFGRNPEEVIRILGIRSPFFGGGA